ncbi:MAG: FAD-dependent oxidoreductase [Xanthomonadales bacterium]|nr:FAD-dependent oxidoreductase [Xanthomonadales bacterium]
MSENNMSRAEFLRANPQAKAWASLMRATEQQDLMTPGPLRLDAGCFNGQRAVIIGSGVSGLATAYELLNQNTGMEVIVLEANNRTGGRCLTLRTSDTLTETTSSELFNNTPGQTQTVSFQQPATDAQPYLNAGPGRIPSSHKRLLHYMKQFGVALEVYVMNSGANLVQLENSTFGDEPLVYRRLEHNTNGWLAQISYQNADALVESSFPGLGESEKDDLAAKLRSLMISFGGLNEEGFYCPEANPDGQDETSSDRAGYTRLPGVDAGVVAGALPWDEILKSEFWSRTRFYQPRDFLWQPTLFQPVGGMDHVQHSFAEQVCALGGTIHLNHPVTKIDYNDSTNKFEIHVAQMGTPDALVIEADVCFSNAAIPFLSELLSDRLQGTAGQGLDDNFQAALQAVYDAQFVPDDGTYKARFQACTTKVGWQAPRNLWQGSGIQEQTYTVVNGDEEVTVNSVPDSEQGVVPIFGGISWTHHPITQVWYPSTAYHDELGTLTGCYNFSENAWRNGRQPIQDRLDEARQGARGFGDAFADGLGYGVAIAWQNMAYIKGGWSQWHVVGNSTEEAVAYFNCLTQGSGVDGSNPKFFIVGDQLSSLPGWQEGAIAAGLNAINRLFNPSLATPHLEVLPDTRLMVEGV